MSKVIDQVKGKLVESKTALCAHGISNEERSTITDYLDSTGRTVAKLTNKSFYVEIGSGHIKDLVLAGDWHNHPESTIIAQVAENCGIPVYMYQKAGELVKLTHHDIIAPLIPGQGIIAPDSDTTEMPHEEAARIVLGPRGEYYDTPLRNFDRTGLIWSGILLDKLVPGVTLTAEDVALCMVGVKIARESFRHKRDNIVDGHGYLITLEMVREEREAIAAAKTHNTTK